MPNANLTILHLCFFTGAMMAIFGWGLICLESDLARASTHAVVAAK
jgi:hypothetical protein